MNRNLAILFACLFVAMVGFGITMPVLPFYDERLALREGASRSAVALHITLLTSIYALMQLLFAPIWGHWSDKFGRRRLVLFAMAGAAATQILFGMANSLWLLYVTRAAGGILSSAMFPAAAAYVSSATSSQERGRSMAWLGAAISLGIVAGLALGGISAFKDLHFFNKTYGHFKIDSFSVPFFAAAALIFFNLLVAKWWLPDAATNTKKALNGIAAKKSLMINWRELSLKLRPLLGLAIVSQFGLTMFEATFALYAQEKMGYGAKEVGAVFLVCGLVMAVFQVMTVGYLLKMVGAVAQLAAGFCLMGIGIVLLLFAHTTLPVLISVSLLALGMALISPNIAVLISNQGGEHTGTALGMQSAANSLGQVGGPLLGGALMAWRIQAPYAFAGALLIGLGMFVGWQNERRTPKNAFQ